MPHKVSDHLPVASIAARVAFLRGQRVLLDSELAELFGVSTARLNQQVRRNRKRFPSDFLFELTAVEYSSLKLHFATSSWGGRRKLPLAFTAHGAIMAATILNTPRAVEMSVFVVRAFVRLRAVLASNKGLARKLAALEQSLATLDAETLRQFQEVYGAIRALTSGPRPKRRPIGFTADLDSIA